ncbi:MAG TPA: LLM class flavin-dependent oxidoreductase [Pseudonocardiaceae bacterium]|nr:LLM class flavin-dependent oxidoreductase [Pseudonocardiaceae bacterium]
MIILPEHSSRRTNEIWRTVDRLGFHHGWTFDHISWHSLPGEPWFDSLTTLASIASVTTRIEIGPLVVSPNFRHPVPTAKQVMTLDHLSEGRVILGIGAGAPGADNAVLGMPALSPADRTARFREFVELTDTLLRQPATSHHGRFFDAVDAQMVPGCLQQPRVPFAIAAGGRLGIKIAAEYGSIWVTIGDPGRLDDQSERHAFRSLREQIRRLEDTCLDIGRDPDSIGRLVNASRIVTDPYSTPERLEDLVGRFAELGFTDVVVNYPRQEGIFAATLDQFERAASALLET